MLQCNYQVTAKICYTANQGIECCMLFLSSICSNRKSYQSSKLCLISGQAHLPANIRRADVNKQGTTMTLLPIKAVNAIRPEDTFLPTDHFFMHVDSKVSEKHWSDTNDSKSSVRDMETNNESFQLLQDAIISIGGKRSARLPWAHFTWTYNLLGRSTTRQGSTIPETESQQTSNQKVPWTKDSGKSSQNIQTLKNDLKVGLRVQKMDPGHWPTHDFPTPDAKTQ